jgi:hypothetical protein
VVGPESWIDIEHLPEAPQQQSCAEKWTEGHGNFGDDQRVVYAMTAESPRPPAALLQHSDQMLSPAAVPGDAENRSFNRHLPCLYGDDGWRGRCIVNDLHLENELQIPLQPALRGTGR